MRALTLSLALLFIGIASHAQHSLIDLDDISFSSELEEEAFERYFRDRQTEPFSLFMVSGKTMNQEALNGALEKFNTQLTALKSEKILSKKNDKKVKLVYDAVHAAFLKKYEIENQFEDIFLNGFYNCVSATALYALVFEALEIPYIIKEKPSHVYLIAYPEQERIVVETTTPAGGAVAINSQFKQSYVKILRDQKMISASEYNAGNVNTIFDKYYFGDDKNIKLMELVGIQYSNQGIYHSVNKRYSDALMQFKKSYLFYPTDRVANMILATAHELFRERQTKDSVHAATLGLMARFKNYGVTKDMIKGEYSNVVQDLLLNHGQADHLKSYHRVVMASLSDQTLKDELDFFYNYENGRDLYNQTRYKEALPYFDSCLNIQPGNQEGVRILIACLSESSKKRVNSETIKILESYSAKHTTLAENNAFNEMLGAAYLTEMRNMFTAANFAQGEKARTDFENFYTKHTGVEFSHYLIGEAYSAAAVYYFKKGNTPKARAILTKGLTISPNNYELVTRKNMIR